MIEWRNFYGKSKLALACRFHRKFPLDIFPSELGKYPIYARLKDWQCCAVATIVGSFFGFNRKEEMKPVYIRQTSMLKFQDRLTAEVRR